MAIFNKSTNSLTKDDLQELLDDAAQEDIRLEFKENDVRKEKTLKELSAFANTFGGYLVIGAKEKDRRVIEFPGLDRSEVKSYPQTITQWCNTGTYPPVQPFISSPIESPTHPGKFCFVIYTATSLEAPHFINGRKGIYIRTDDLNHPFEPQLAKYEEIQHLASRRQMSVERRRINRRKSEEKLARETHKSWNSEATKVKLIVTPLFPTQPLCETLELHNISRRSTVKFKKSLDYSDVPNGIPITYHEGLVISRVEYGEPFIDINIWGQIFYGFVFSTGVHNDRLDVTHFLRDCFIYLKHAAKVNQNFGYNGLLQVTLQLSNTLNKEFVDSSPLIFSIRGKSTYDDEIEFIYEVRSDELENDSDSILSSIIKDLLIALDNPNLAEDESKIAMLAESSKVEMLDLENN